MVDAEVQCQVYGRVKHLFSIFRKMVNQGKTLDEIYDIFAIRMSHLFFLLEYRFLRFAPFKKEKSFISFAHTK